MTKTTIRFILEAVPNSEYDLWKPLKGGASKVRPKKITTRYWPGHSSDRSKVRELSESLWRELGLPNDSGWTEIDLDSPKLPLLVRRLQELRKAGLVYPVRGTVEIRLVDSPDDPCSWFELFNWKNSDAHVSGVTCKADRARPGIHVAGRYVSEKFKSIVEKNGFRGVEFLWLHDKGKYAAPQWYRPIPRHPIGRGIDHEFFNSGTLAGDGHAQPNEPLARNGVICFDREQLKTPAPFAEPLQNELLSMFHAVGGTNGVGFYGYRQYLRRFLPDADFAFAWREAAVRSMCFNRNVRDALLEARVLLPEECLPVKVWDTAPAWAEVLDESAAAYPRACPDVSDDDLVKLRREANEAWLLHLAKPKPPRQFTLAQGLASLKIARARNPASFRAKLTAKQLDAVNDALGKTALPGAWAKVLSVIGPFDFDLDDSLSVIGPESLLEFNRSTNTGAQAGRADFPGHLLHITKSLSGDFHSLDLSTLTSDGDCRVLQFSHETLQPEREWDGIASFIQEICDSMETSETSK